MYDVTKYLDDHPGGAEVMLDVAGQDADEFFEDIGHSNDARKELTKYYIGEYKIDPAVLAKMKADAEKAAAAYIVIWEHHANHYRGSTSNCIWLLQDTNVRACEQFNSLKYR